jgi:hypothetical protein
MILSENEDLRKAKLILDTELLLVLWKMGDFMELLDTQLEGHESIELDYMTLPGIGCH